MRVSLHFGELSSFWGIKIAQLEIGAVKFFDVRVSRIGVDDGLSAIVAIYRKIARALNSKVSELQVSDFLQGRRKNVSTGIFGR
jgi:hypothetical protein